MYEANMALNRLFENQRDPLPPFDVVDDILHLSAALTHLRIHGIVTIGRLETDPVPVIQTFSAKIS